MSKQYAIPGCGVSEQELLDEAVDVVRRFAPEGGSPYYGCFSGGKDSVALREVALIAGVTVAWHYNVTTIDPPELVRFVREQHSDVAWVRSPHGPFFRRAAEVKGFPTRLARWCCNEYKEARSPRGARLLMGIRAAESPRRAAAWDHATPHRRTGDYAINPILRWPDSTLWAFIRDRALPVSELYAEGFARLGCVGCPMARGGRLRAFARWPRFGARWRHVFQRTWERRHGTTQRGGLPWFGDAYFTRWEEMWDWWLHDVPLPPRLDGGAQPWLL